ncbi:hypothetical protein ASG49_10665 [Marmoricola sp. Leaf446]|uniref:hypothetical protein n=1 Tax=Marmoricola sp. Leaf446 TaxID=1736379 RepID=UPI0006FACF43|nr:hypothetical protein [Marmoricola sp. Leaf446]KQT91482.1 hypothetical protein ASG49_10665 [Marmoricola sp. Leaf446]
MNRSRALSPWLQVPVGLVLLAAGLYSPWLFDEDRQRAEVMASDRVCDPGTAVGADDCLVPVPGSLTDRRGRTSQRYHFEPDDPAVDDAWVRFSGDETSRGGAMPTLLAGAPVTALYAGDTVVAFDVDGERVVEMSGEPGRDRTTLWAGLWLGSLGALMLLGVWHRRTSWDDFPRRGRTGLVGATLTTVMLASFCAFFAGSLRAELITFGVVAGPVALLVLWGRWRTRRRTQRWSA